MKGKMIVIDGMDGTGKETQSKLLYNKLKENNEKVELFSFPNYYEDSSYFVKKWLNEGYCRDIDNPILHNLFYAIDRCITYNKHIKEKYEDGYIIILDRYVTANVIYTLNEFQNKTMYCKIANEIEHIHLELPKPDINIVLYSVPEINTKLIEERCKSENVEADLNENLEFQTKIFNNIQYLNNISSSFFGKIETLLIHDIYGKINTREEIADQIMNIVEKYI